MDDLLLPLGFVVVAVHDVPFRDLAMVEVGAVQFREDHVPGCPVGEKWD